jgi:DNA polymerase-3 subunit gamma/tau
VAGWPLDTVLAAQQILAEARLRLRGSPHARLLVELALVRVARLENFSELAEVVARLSTLERTGPAAPARDRPVPNAAPRHAEPAASAPAVAQKTPADSSPSPAHAETAGGLSLDRVLKHWTAFIEKVGLRYGARLSQVRPAAVAEPDALVIRLKPDYNSLAEECGTPEAKARIEGALKAVYGLPVKLRFDKLQADSQEEETHPSNPGPPRQPPADELGADPLVQKVVELFEARRILVDAADETKD